MEEDEAIFFGRKKNGRYVLRVKKICGSPISIAIEVMIGGNVARISIVAFWKKKGKLLGPSSIVLAS